MLVNGWAFSGILLFIEASLFSNVLPLSKALRSKALLWFPSFGHCFDRWTAIGQIKDFFIARSSLLNWWPVKVHIDLVSSLVEPNFLDSRPSAHLNVRWTHSTWMHLNRQCAGYSLRCTIFAFTILLEILIWIPPLGFRPISTSCLGAPTGAFCWADRFGELKIAIPLFELYSQ